MLRVETSQESKMPFSNSGDDEECDISLRKAGHEERLESIVIVRIRQECMFVALPERRRDNTIGAIV